MSAGDEPAAPSAQARPGQGAASVDLMHPSPEALAGLRVLDVSTGVAGQFAGRVLAEHGADVLLIEPPGGCALRHTARAEDRHLFRHLNTGKRALALDRNSAAGRAAFADLVAHADVLLGEAPEDFSPYLRTHPRLVTCTVRDFARSGPYADWRGSEMIHQALSGLMHATGRAEREPLYGFGHRAYYAAGAAAVSAILGALLLVRRHGRGQALEICVHETAIAMSQNLVAQYSYNGSQQLRGPYPGACDIFECSDGWVSMYCRGDRWAALCTGLGDAGLPADPRFASIDALIRHWAAAYARLAPRVRLLKAADFIACVEAARGLAARVMTMADLRACPHLQARGFWETVANASAAQPMQSAQPVLGPLFRLSATPRRVRTGAPELTVAPEATASTLAWTAPVQAPSAPLNAAASTPAAAAAMSSTDAALPLAGLRVLEISTAWAGPMLGRILREFGADVLKIESLDAIDNWRGAVKGDDTIRYPNFEPGARPYNRNAWFNSQNLGKRSLGLDLKSAAARPAIEALVAACDMVISNFAAGALQRMRLGYEDLRALQPGIVLLEMGVAGAGGRLANTRGVGPTMEALAGMTVLTGYGDGVPQRTGPAYVDPIGALNGAMAALLAVYHHARSGQGQRIELAQRESLMHWYGERVLLQASEGIELTPRGNQLSDAAPHDAYRARGDEAWVAIAVFDATAWRALCDVIGRPELCTDARLADARGRIEHAVLVRSAIEAWSRGQDKHAAAQALQRAGVCAAPVCSGADVFHDPQLAASGFLFEVDHPEAGRHRYHGLPFRFAGARDARQAAAPLLGQHTDEVLRSWAGLDEAAIAQLHRAGAALQVQALSV